MPGGIIAHHAPLQKITAFKSLEREIKIYTT